MAKTTTLSTEQRLAVAAWRQEVIRAMPESDKGHTFQEGSDLLAVSRTGYALQDGTPGTWVHVDFSYPGAGDSVYAKVAYVFGAFQVVDAFHPDSAEDDGHGVVLETIWDLDNDNA